eukprot:6127817-Pleurochrysis_carterae.AAC.1
MRRSNQKDCESETPRARLSQQVHGVKTGRHCVQQRSRACLDAFSPLWLAVRTDDRIPALLASASCACPAQASRRLESRLQKSTRRTRVTRTHSRTRTYSRTHARRERDAQEREPAIEGDREGMKRQDVCSNERSSGPRSPRRVNAASDRCVASRRSLSATRTPPSPFCCARAS